MAPQQPHFLLVTFPFQGHINPSLQFAKRLLRIGSRVTLCTCSSAQRYMGRTMFPDGLSFATFSDEGLKPNDDSALYMTEVRRRGSQTLHDVILRNESDGDPFTCVVYTLLLPWVAEVARDHHLPFALLWIQPATVFHIYYHYFSEYGDVLFDCNNPSFFVDLPGLPRLKNRDLPSFISNPQQFPFFRKALEEQFVEITNETNRKVLVNSFDLLEPKSLTTLEKVEVIGIGPLVPSAFSDGKDPYDKSFGCDLIKSENDDNYIQWLRTKPEASVVYVSFGTISLFSKRQMEEIARGLIESGFPFLWVIREAQKEQERKESESESESETGSDQLVGLREELEKRGMIVSWCSQVEVLSDPAVGCFVTHCGWNSTVESLVCGVPVVAFPRWSDQGTNAKLIEDEWKTGVRVKVEEAAEGMTAVVVKGEEIRRCLDLVMVDGSEMRENAKKWRDLAREAVAEGGSSDKNIGEFYRSSCAISSSWFLNKVCEKKGVNIKNEELQIAQLNP